VVDLQDDTKDFRSATTTDPAANGLEESKLVMIQEHGISSIPRISRSGTGAIRARDESVLTLPAPDQELRSSATLSNDY
jgi:hypothetical protein